MKVFPVAFVDADFDRNEPTGKSVGGHLIFFGGPIIFASKTQTRASSSTAMAETIALDRCANDCAGVFSILAALGFCPSRPIPIFEDNAAAVQGVRNHGTGYQSNKSYTRVTAAIRSLEDRKIIRVRPVGTSDQLADVLTKPMGITDLDRFAKLIAWPTQYYFLEYHKLVDFWLSKPDS